MIIKTDDGKIKITLPLTDDDIKELHAGDSVLISGSLITGRDAAHKRLYELIEEGKELPVDIKGEVIYYVGPAPAKPGHATQSDSKQTEQNRYKAGKRGSGRRRR